MPRMKFVRGLRLRASVRGPSASSAITFAMAGSFAGACGPPTPNLFTTAVLTQHNNAQRTGANTGETVLNTTNVRTADFGTIWEYPVRGRIYAQPLFATDRKSTRLNSSH